MDSFQYSFKLKSETDQGSKVYSFETADGVASKEGFRKAELLLADTVETGEEEDLLVLYPGYGFLGVIFADYTPEGKTVLAESSDRAHKITKHNLKLNDIENTQSKKISSPKDIEQSFDKVLYAPKPYANTDIVKNNLTEAINLLEEDGELYLASSKKEGLNRYKDWLKQFDGELDKINSRDGYHVYRYSKQGEIEDRKVDVERSFEAEINGVKANFETVEGLFSPTSLDKGSRLLIENIEADSGDKVWDVACGYGAIGIFLKKLYDPEIYFSDNNLKAVKQTGRNLQLNEIEKYSLEHADCLDTFEGKKFDKIVSNPPTHQGKGITDEIFQNSYQRLRKGGELYIVYNQNMNYEQQLEQIFKKVEILEKKDNYAVTRATK
ncbi:MAG: methyltransferase [Candidatus Nanohalobium sp.]